MLKMTLKCTDFKYNVVRIDTFSTSVLLVNKMNLRLK